MPERPCWDAALNVVRTVGAQCFPTQLAKGGGELRGAFWKSRHGSRQCEGEKRRTIAASSSLQGLQHAPAEAQTDAL